MTQKEKKFTSGQVVFAVPSYRYFHKLDYQSSGDRPQPYDYAWIVGPSGEFYKSYTNSSKTEVKDSDHKEEFRATWPEALQVALANVRRQARVVADIVADEMQRRKK